MSMSEPMLTAEQAAQELGLHAKTLLRYIREGRLRATKVGKSYRIARSDFDAFAGIVSGRAEPGDVARATCVVDIPDLSTDRAERLATFLQAMAMSRDAQTPALHLQTAFDPAASTMKIVVIGSPLDVGRILEMLDVQTRRR